MYRAKNDLVNGNIINDLLSLCNNWFTDPWVQPYAGANAECVFCGCLQDKHGNGHHSAADCPTIHLHDIVKKYPKHLIKIRGKEFRELMDRLRKESI